MSEDNGQDERNPFTKPGFIVAAVVLFVVIVLGVYLIWSGNDEEETPTESQQQTEAVEQTPEPEQEPEDTDGESVCGLPGVADEGETLTRAPSADSWGYDGITSYPVSDEYGPAETDNDGVRYCFQQSPEGALFFAANAVEQGEAEQVSEWIDYAVSDGDYRDQLITEVSGNAGDDIRLEVVGFRVMSFSPDEAVVQLAIDGQTQGESVQISTEFALVWEDGDWKYDGNREEPISMVPVGAHGNQIVRWSEGD